MNSFFATIGQKLSDNPADNVKGATVVNADTKNVPLLVDFNVSWSKIRYKVDALKTNKSTGPDDIQPKLLKLASDSIVPYLLSLYRRSIETKKKHNLVVTPQIPVESSPGLKKTKTASGTG